ncbi:hypothetical protein IAF28_21080, partial [Acinetobacter baumannii]|nr:hypothetical protein [Acinetobacter baumannii]
MGTIWNILCHTFCNLACRIQAAGMGLGAVFTPTGFGTLLAEGKETRHIDGKDYVL